MGWVLHVVMGNSQRVGSFFQLGRDQLWRYSSTWNYKRALLDLNVCSTTDIDCHIDSRMGHWSWIRSDLSVRNRILWSAFAVVHLQCTNNNVRPDFMGQWIKWIWPDLDSW